MPKFVRKAALDRYPEVAGGRSSADWTHVLLTEEEYNELLRKISVAERDVSEAKQRAERAISDAKWEAAQKAQQVRQEAQEQVAAIQGELEQERAESAHQRALNANLLRVSRERANADRNLKPKKERCGYVVVNSEEKETGFRAGGKRLHKVMLWETTIQTPYSVQMAEAVVRKQIEEDLFPAGKKAMIVGRIGITGKFNGSYEKFLEGKTQNPEDSFYNGNVVISRQQRLKRRFRLEYWEVAIVHTKPLGDIPEDLLPFEKKPVQGA